MNRSRGLLVAIVLLVIVIGAALMLRNNQAPIPVTTDVVQSEEAAPAAPTEQVDTAEADDTAPAENDTTEDDTTEDDTETVAAAEEDVQPTDVITATDTITTTATTTANANGTITATTSVTETASVTTSVAVTETAVITSAESAETIADSATESPVADVAAISGSGIAGEAYTVVDIDPMLLDGEILFIDNCAKCHGLQGYGDGPSVGSLGTLTGNMSLAILDSKSDEELLDAITNGRGVEMPPWGLVMNVEQREAVLAYVRTLSLSNQ